MTSASIIIPVFNRAHLVRRAIESSLAQTERCEVILVDHGSTDAIEEVAAEYEGRIRYVRRKEDRGPVACWRDGIEHSTGEYVHINFDDDWIQPTFMEETLAILQSGVGFVYARSRVHLSPDDSGIVSLIHPPGVRPSREFVQHALGSKLTVSPGAAVFRRRDALSNLLPEVPGARGRYGPGTGVGEDLLLFLLTTLDYPTYGHVPLPLADFMAHQGSITVSALDSNLGKELAAAYERAREHYLRQEGALQPLRGLPAFTSRVKWLLASGSVSRKLVNHLKSHLPGQRFSRRP